MDELQLKEMFEFVKGNPLFKTGEAKSLGKIAGYFMDGGVPMLTLDSDVEVAVSKITEEKKYVIGEGGGSGGRKPQQQSQQPNNQQRHDDDDDDDDINPAAKAKLAPVDNTIKMDEHGIPILQKDPDFAHLDKKANVDRPLHGPAATKNVLKGSPIVALLEKAKPKSISISIELDIDAYDETLIGVLLTNFETAHKDIIDHIISKITDEKLKGEIARKLREFYKFTEEK